MSNAKFRSFLSFMAFVSLVMVGLALIITFVFKGNQISVSLNLIANVISYAVVASTAYFYARSKRNIWFMLVWVLAIVLIIVFQVLNVL